MAVIDRLRHLKEAPLNYLRHKVQDDLSAITEVSVQSRNIVFKVENPKYGSEFFPIAIPQRASERLHNLLTDTEDKELAFASAMFEHLDVDINSVEILELEDSVYRATMHTNLGKISQVQPSAAITYGLLAGASLLVKNKFLLDNKGMKRELEGSGLSLQDLIFRNLRVSYSKGGFEEKDMQKDRYNSFKFKEDGLAQSVKVGFSPFSELGFIPLGREIIPFKRYERGAKELIIHSQISSHLFVHMDDVRKDYDLTEDGFNKLMHHDFYSLMLYFIKQKKAEVSEMWLEVDRNDDEHVIGLLKDALVPQKYIIKIDSKTVSVPERFGSAFSVIYNGNVFGKENFVRSALNESQQYIG